MNNPAFLPQEEMFIAIFVYGIFVLLKYTSISGGKYRKFLQIKRIVYKKKYKQDLKYTIDIH